MAMDEDDRVRAVEGGPQMPYDIHCFCHLSYETLSRMFEPSLKKSNKTRDRPKALHFKVSDEMKHFNRLVMQNLSVIKHNCQLANLLDEFKTTFTKAEVNPSYSDLYIFWVSDSKETSEVVQNALDENASEVRNELNNLRLFGQVPKISFIKDTKVGQSERLFQIIDGLDISDDTIEVDETFREESCRPKLKHNVLNLDRDKILSQVSEYAILHIEINKTINMYFLSFVTDHKILEQSQSYTQN